MKIESKDDIKALFKSLKVKYLTSYPIKVSGLKDVDLTDTEYYRDNCAEFKQLADTYGDKIRNSYVGPVYIKKTPSRGYGLFAADEIKPGDFLGIYFGVVKKQEEMVSIDDTGIGTDYAWDYPDELEGFPAIEIDAKPEGSEMRFANHDFNSNLQVEHTVIDNCWYIFFIADRKISKDEELTISYGESYWDSEYRELS